MFKFVPKRIKTERIDFEAALKVAVKADKMLPYRLRWRAFGKRVKTVDVVFTSERAIYMDISYYDEVKEVMVADEL